MCLYKTGSYLNLILLLVIIKTIIVFAPSAMAQATPRIFVDLSVLATGEGRRDIASDPKLAIPPSTTPLSTLHVAPKKQLKIKSYSVLKKLSKKKQSRTKMVKSPFKVEIANPIKTSALPRKNNSLGSKRPAQEKLNPLAPTLSTAPVTKVANVPVPPPPPTVNTPAPPGPKVLKAPPAAPKIVERAAPASSKAKTSATEIAKLTSEYQLKPGRALRIVFNDTDTRVPKTEKTKILSLANAVRGKENLRLQVLAYAGGQNLSNSKTRRMSLSRALAVRSLLIVNGVRSTQIDIRALGNKTDEKPFNRVDLDLAKR